ncbi:glycogen/starch synthase [Streptomyces sp. NPDC000345]|uniref:glycogen/starch synthase n=1 Tax=Streptomyces sp. NPDC000345 TaxID=3364537 RepID=UPI0036CEC9FF
MKCLYITQEYAPLFSEGGLGLTSAALPAALDSGHGTHHDLVLPYYPRLVDRLGLQTEEVCVLPERRVTGIRSCATVHRLLGHRHSGDIFLIRADAWYDRPGMYRDEQYRPFADEAARGAFFGWCVAEWAAAEQRGYDLVHGNDWQSGAAMAHLRDRFPGLPQILTIHNGLYTGDLRTDELDALLMPASALQLLRQHAGERPSLLLAALLAADAVVTCSAGYVDDLLRETRGTAVGAVLERMHPTGIVFGVDTGLWDPAAVDRPTCPYDASTVLLGKQLNKQELQKTLELRADDDVPVIGVCSRLVHEKGSDLLLEALEPMLRGERAQLVLVGPADGCLRERLRALLADVPEYLAYVPRFDQEIAWLTYAGSDLTVMPSRVEPCGLNQLIAYRYGTLPVASPVGGLRDTVIDVRVDPVHGGGFLIPEHSVGAVRATVDEALAWLERPDEPTAVRTRVMRQDWSWARTAGQYAQVYARLGGRGA